MAKRGGKRHIKRLASPKRVHVHDKKEKTFLAVPTPGPHPRDFSTTLLHLLRDMVGVSHTSREANYVLHNKEVKVDGKVRRDARFPVGFMDVVDIEGDKVYRILIDTKGRLVSVEDNRPNLKPLQIKRKVSVDKENFQLTFHDGRTFLTKDNSYKVGDVVLFDLSSKKIVQHVPFKEGANCLIIEGKHAGERGTLKKIEVRGGNKVAILEGKDHELITRAAYLFPLPEGW